MRLAMGTLGIPGFITLLGTLASTALPAVGTALRVLAVAATAHPIIALITLLAAAAGTIWANWDTLGPKFTALWYKIKAIFQSGVQYVVDKLNSVKQAFGVSVDYKQIAPPAAPHTPLRAPGGTVNTTHNNAITVNAAPGQSAVDVGRAVRAEMDARDRDRATQRRSIFADAN